MKTLTKEEIKDWCADQDVALGDCGTPIHLSKGFSTLRLELPKDPTQLTWLSRFVEESLTPRDRCLLWVTEWSVWPNAENWHLYYRLRESYGDHRLLDEAPGHLFLNFEAPDLTSFLQIGLLCGWDIHLLPTVGYGRAFVSHDGWIELYLLDAVELNNLKSTLSKANIKIIVPQANPENSNLS